MMTKRFMAGAVLAMSFLVLPAGAEEIDREFHETFEVNEGMRLRLVHGDGDVTIEPWERNVLEVDVKYHAEVTILGLGRKDADFVVDFDQRGDEISVIGRETGRGGFHIGINTSRRHDYTYTIKAPSFLELELEGDDGEVLIEGWRADVEVQSDDGDVTLSDVRTERVSVEIEDGDFVARDMETELFLTADDGDMSISGCAISWGRIRFEDGDLEMDDCVGDFDVAADDGSVRMNGIETSELDVRADDGDVRLELVGGQPRRHQPRE